MVPAHQGGGLRPGREAARLLASNALASGQGDRFLFFADSGSGKTYFLASIIRELARLRLYDAILIHDGKGIEGAESYGPLAGACVLPSVADLPAATSRVVCFSGDARRDVVCPPSSMAKVAWTMARAGKRVLTVYDEGSYVMDETRPKSEPDYVEKGFCEGRGLRLSTCISFQDPLDFPRYAKTQHERAVIGRTTDQANRFLRNTAAYPPALCDAVEVAPKRHFTLRTKGETWPATWYTF